MIHVLLARPIERGYENILLFYIGGYSIMDVIVYTKNQCPACEATKAWLTSNGVKFKLRNISEDEEWKEKVLQMGFSSVPVTVIGEKIVAGFNPSALAEVLGL